MITFAAQPTEKGAFEQLSVETVGLGAPVFTRYRYARCVDNVGLDAACPEPARQPETIPAGLEGNCSAFDLASCFLSFLTPAIEKLQQCALVDRGFFNGWRSTPGTMPATSQLDKLISITAISVLSCFRTIRDWLRSFGVCIGGLHRFTSATMDAFLAAAP